MAMIAGFGAAVQAGEYRLTIERIDVVVAGRTETAIGVNGSLPAPTLHFHEGEEVAIHVTNRLDEDASVHWHGFILPYRMDGVPGISFPGISPGETFTYRFQVKQSGTYWYHSHSGLQIQTGLYGGIVIEPRTSETRRYDRDYVVLLSDWTRQKPQTVLAKLKKQSDYFNYNKLTLLDFARDMWAAKTEDDRGAILRERMAWGKMRMDPTDVSDVTDYTFLVNGRDPEQNWTASFRAGERVRLRLINGSAMTFFDVRIPGLPLEIVSADGQEVQPITVDEIRIAVGETYDVIVTPPRERAYTLFAAAMDRTGYARGTLAPYPGAEAEIPPMPPRQVLTIASLGPAHAHGSHGGHGSHGDHATGSPKEKKRHTDATHRDETDEETGRRVLSYADLRGVVPIADQRKPERTLTMRLTGNMERYFWSIDDKKYSESEPIRLQHNERLRIRMINETMMNHPMHLHGHWMELVNGAGAYQPRKHVINVGPGEIVDFDVTADAFGYWPFHCHLLYHMATGMFRKIVVGDPDRA